jgi:hypothetical protein
LPATPGLAPLAARSLKSLIDSTDEREVIMCALCGEWVEPTALSCASCAAPIEHMAGDASAVGAVIVRTRTGGYYRPASALLLDPPIPRTPSKSIVAINRNVNVRLAVGLALGLAVGGIAAVQIAAVL